jgi:hypothetical protein
VSISIGIWYTLHGDSQHDGHVFLKHRFLSLLLNIF